MNIQEAVQRALVEGKFITRESFSHLKIQPTNRIGYCILSSIDNSTQPRGGWQPSAEDLTADDWKVIKADYGKYKSAKFSGMTIEL